jgi:hypothetical protein
MLRRFHDLHWLSVMLFSFGSSVSFLCVDRWKRLRAITRPSAREMAPID